MRGLRCDGSLWTLNVVHATPLLPCVPGLHGGQSGQTPLHMAAAHHNVPRIDALMVAGANASALDNVRTGGQVAMGVHVAVCTRVWL